MMAEHAQFRDGLEDDPRMSRPPDRGAYHEAGHAVAALCRGIPFESVSVLPERASLGRLILGPLFLEITGREELIGRCVVALAGPYAQSVSVRQPLEFGDTDIDNVSEILLRIAPVEAEREALRALIETEAHALIETHWDLIVRTAELLQQRSTIVSEELVMLLSFTPEK